MTAVTAFDGISDAGLLHLQAQLLPVITANSKVRAAYAAAELALDGITLEQFANRCPGVDPIHLLSDPEVASLVETFASRADVQDAAMNIRLRRGMGNTLTVLTAKLEDPDCTASMARDIGDTMTKLSNLLDRRGDAGYREPERQLVLFMGDARVFTPEGETLVCVECAADVLAVIRAMRCTSEAECEAVIRVFAASLMSGDLTLRGW
jgi:hypothetical protein